MKREKALIKNDDYPNGKWHGIASALERKQDPSCATIPLILTNFQHTLSFLLFLTSHADTTPTHRATTMPSPTRTSSRTRRTKTASTPSTSVPAWRPPARWRWRIRSSRTTSRPCPRPRSTPPQRRRRQLEQRAKTRPRRPPFLLAPPAAKHLKPKRARKTSENKSKEKYQKWEMQVWTKDFETVVMTTPPPLWVNHVIRRVKEGNKEI